MSGWTALNPVQKYWLDAWQRSILFLDVLRERGNTYFEHNASKVPHVLDFQAELVRDGRTLLRPVNYGLVRIVPPEGVKIDPTKPPFIVVDPRAGHGSLRAPQVLDAMYPARRFDVKAEKPARGEAVNV